MMFHTLFGKHEADPAEQRWQNGLFVSACLVCRRAMVKPVNRDWQLAAGPVRR